MPTFLNSRRPPKKKVAHGYSIAQSAAKFHCEWQSSDKGGSGYQTGRGCSAVEGMEKRGLPRPCLCDKALFNKKDNNVVAGLWGSENKIVVISSPSGGHKV